MNQDDPRETSAPAIDWQALKAAATQVREHAYAPYSNFKVGAAIQAGGRIFKGCNMENASYPVGLCAERGALAAVIAAGLRRIEAVVITADKPITPCGMCRQSLAEFNPEVPILMLNGELEAEATLDQLFPLPFALK